MAFQLRKLNFDYRIRNSEHKTAMPIYLDNNSTTPLDPAVLEAMLPYFREKFGNAASTTHAFGWVADQAVADAREQVAALIGAEAGEMVFTSGATEAINLALKGVFETYRGKGNHIITASTEHKAVLDTCHHLTLQGARITMLPVQSDGLLDPDELSKHLGPETILVCVMMANNETGVIQPVREFADRVHEAGALFMSDATQACGKIQVNVSDDHIDLLPFSAHKLYGPKGVGALYVRRKNPRVKLTAQIDGGGHEHGLRSGTLNVPGIVGFGKACSLASQKMWDDAQKMSVLRTKLEQALLDFGNVSVNGNTKARLPNTTNLSFSGIRAPSLLKEVGDIALSTGSACSSALAEPSHVLRAMGLTDEIAYSSVRFSLGRFTTEEEIETSLIAFGRAIKKLRDE